MWSGQLAFDELEESDDFDDFDSDDLDSDGLDSDGLESVELDEEPSVAEVVDEAPRVSVT